jgi:hypothetical protein
MKANGKMDWEMDKESLFGLTKASILEGLRMIRLVARAN